MHNLRLHGGGIAECPTCGTIYRLVAERGRPERQEGFDCLMCGDRLDTLIGTHRRVYELVASPQVDRVVKL
jgi:hypothetical protein